MLNEHLDNRRFHQVQRAIFIQVPFYPLLVNLCYQLLPQKGSIIQLMVLEVVYVVEVKVGTKRHVDRLKFCPLYPLDLSSKSPFSLLDWINRSLSLGRW